MHGVCAVSSDEGPPSDDPPMDLSLFIGARIAISGGTEEFEEVRTAVHLQTVKEIRRSDSYWQLTDGRSLPLSRPPSRVRSV